MDSRTELQNGYEIKIGEEQYIIEKVIGFGGTSIVYDAYYFDQLNVRHGVRIKELYPVNVGVSRDPETCELSGVNEERKKHFISSVKLQNRLMAEAVNSTASAYSFYEINGTVYQVLAYYNGYDLSNLMVDNIHDYFGVLQKVAENISCYHNMGYLCIDIKPANVLLLPDNSESVSENSKVLMIDFDSLIKSDEIGADDIWISYTSDYAAPELRCGSIDKISFQTDYYAIGCMLFEKVFGRLPGSDDRESMPEWDLRENALLKNCPEFVIEKTEEFLKKTIAAYPKRRYQNDKEIAAALHELYTYSEIRKPYLVSNYYSLPNSFFIGRYNELISISNKLSESHKVFLQGVGGIGKTHLALKYAEQNIQNYDYIIFAKYCNSFEELFKDDNLIKIQNMPEYDESELYERKYELFSKLCSESRVLFIVDNYDTDDIVSLEEKCLGLSCDVIVTTRMYFSEYSDITVDVKGIFEAQGLFYHYCKRDFTADERQTIENIIKYVDHHTMTVELLGKLMRDKDVSPDEIYSKFTSCEVQSLPEKDVRNIKDMKAQSKSVSQYIAVLFDVSSFSQDEILILRTVSLIIDRYMHIEILKKFCPDYSEKDYKTLIRRGWIQKSRESEMFEIHPMIHSTLLSYYWNIDKKIVETAVYVSCLGSFDIKWFVNISDRINGRDKWIADYCLWSSFWIENDERIRILDKAYGIYSSISDTFYFDAVRLYLGWKNFKEIKTEDDYNILHSKFRNVIYTLRLLLNYIQNNELEIIERHLLYEMAWRLDLSYGANCNDVRVKKLQYLLLYRYKEKLLLLLFDKSESDVEKKHVGGYISILDRSERYDKYKNYNSYKVSDIKQLGIISEKEKIISSNIKGLEKYNVVFSKKIAINMVYDFINNLEPIPENCADLIVKVLIKAGEYKVLDDFISKFDFDSCPDLYPELIDITIKNGNTETAVDLLIRYEAYLKKEKRRLLNYYPKLLENYLFRVKLEYDMKRTERKINYICMKILCRGNFLNMYLINFRNFFFKSSLLLETVKVFINQKKYRKAEMVLMVYMYWHSNNRFKLENKEIGEALSYIIKILNMDSYSSFFHLHVLLFLGVNDSEDYFWDAIDVAKNDFELEWVTMDIIEFVIGNVDKKTITQQIPLNLLIDFYSTRIQDGGVDYFYYATYELKDDYYRISWRDKQLELLITLLMESFDESVDKFNEIFNLICSIGDNLKGNTLNDFTYIVGDIIGNILNYNNDEADDIAEKIAVIFYSKIGAFLTNNEIDVETCEDIKKIQREICIIIAKLYLILGIKKRNGLECITYFDLSPDTYLFENITFEIEKNYTLQLVFWLKKSLMICCEQEYIKEGINFVDYDEMSRICRIIYQYTQDSVYLEKSEKYHQLSILID